MFGNSKKGVNDIKETDGTPIEESEKKESEENPSKDELKMTKEHDSNLMTFGGHLEVFRRMLFRIIAVAGTLSVIIFFCKRDHLGTIVSPK